MIPEPSPTNVPEKLFAEMFPITSKESALILSATSILPENTGLEVLANPVS